MSLTKRDGLRALEADHVYLEGLLTAVVAAARSNDGVALLSVWNAFERHLALDLHTVRADGIEQLATRLREHAQREHAWLYPWAEQALDEARMAHITRRLKAGWKRAGHVIRHHSDAREQGA